jgi:hypothetical protein
MQKHYTHFLFLILILYLIHIPAIYSQDKIEILFSGKTLIVNDYNVMANCCTKYKDDVQREGNKIIITQTDTSTTKCYCNCNFDLTHSISNLSNGIYKIEIYRTELKKYGYVEDKTYLVWSGEFEVTGSTSQKVQTSTDFSQLDCKKDTRISTKLSNQPIKLEVYPNPAKSEVTLKFSAPGESDSRISVYNFLGKEVYSLEKKNLEEGIQTISLNLDSLPVGMYIGKLFLSTGKTETFKIVWSK